MNAFVKSAVAGAAGIALLLGGAGTFAVWNSSASASAGVLRTGQLSLATTPGTGQWKDLRTGSLLSDAELSSYRMIPGTQLEYTVPVTVTASGTGLKAVFSYDLGATTSTLTSVVPVLTVQTSRTDTASPAGFAPVSGRANAFSVTPSTSSTTAVARLGVSVPTDADNSTQDKTLDLTKVVFTLTQVE
ncbi:alternate-type signal peptide domain-containing protein [Frigoribacterium faeni]|uniref:alternate-type signal peptide domain-containing protein n=1 Tax=Frigoribacterium faeni TaxID=145483 RepID=UPI00141B8A6F|nr:alternate-type signal peptide domain-containing protein [Frigoribacterium faeni]NIJ04023.1 alternate signal-mediated exported protein [Frigoribacterium faeni]